MGEHKNTTSRVLNQSNPMSVLKEGLLENHHYQGDPLTTAIEYLASSGSPFGLASRSGSLGTLRSSNTHWLWVLHKPPHCKANMSCLSRLNKKPPSIISQVDYYSAQRTWAKHQKYHTTNLPLGEGTKMRIALNSAVASLWPSMSY